MARINIFGGLSALDSPEKKTLQKIKRHVETTYDALVELDYALAAFENGEMDLFSSKKDTVDSLEKKADRLRREIEEDLYSGAFLPISRSRILDFSENVDKVADIAEDTAKMLVFIDRKQVPDDLLTLLREGVERASESVKLLVEGLEDIENPDKVRDIIRMIRAEEHECDELANHAYAIVYQGPSEAVRLHILCKLIEFVSDLSDLAEDASDALSLIVLMHKV